MYLILFKKTHRVVLLSLLIPVLAACENNGELDIGSIIKKDTRLKEVKFKKVESKGKYKAHVIPEDMSVDEKKQRFKALLVPPIQKVYKDLHIRYQKVSLWLKDGTHEKDIAALKEEYKAETDEELLAALKPHPPSIVIAQAAMESAWGTSRFFVEANNVFGVWSFDDEEPRIAAGEQRDGEETIWVKKYKSIEDSVRDYYRVLARGHAHQHFRDARLETNNPHELVTNLDRYSEMGEAYGEEISSMIRYNNFVEYGPIIKEATN